MKKFVAALGVFGCIAVLFATSGRTEQEENVSKFMRAKLAHTQEVLAGLALEDFEGIAKHGQELSLLSRATEWQVLQTPEYQRHSEDFRRSADLLTEAGKKQNIDAASLAYVEMTLKCVRCHKYVRQVRTASLDDFPARKETAR